MKASKYVLWFLFEFLSTALLVSCTCTSRILLSNALLPVSIVYGFLNWILISCFGEICDAYANPAVVLALYCRGGISIKRFLIYTAAEILGGIVGAFGFYMIFGKYKDYTLFLFQMRIELMDTEIMGAEFLLTFLFVTIWCALWEYVGQLPLEVYVGCLHSLMYLIGIYLVGATANPSRIIAHAFLRENYQQTAMMCLVGQYLGALAAPLLWRFSQLLTN